MKKTILALRAETSIHAGTGQNSGVVDLPIQREKHTGYPCIYGSAMKGALRAHAEMRSEMNNIVEVFGPDTKNASDHAGAIVITDARLLLLPVRSLTGHFKWVTCPTILQRLRRDIEMLGGQLNLPDGLDDMITENVYCHGTSDDIFLEEFRFTQVDKKLSDLCIKIQQFADLPRLEEKLIIMSDPDFAWFATNATAITPHIAIDNETKVVCPGALWYEESLPSDTVMYSMIMANDSRNGHMDAAAISDAFHSMFKSSPYLQVGGNETVGMGWCKVREVQP